MMNVSSEFRSLVKSGVKLVNYADITLKDGTVLNLGPSDFSVGGFSMTDKTSNGKFEIGTAIAKTITVTIANHTNKFSAYDFYKAIIYMYIAVEKADGTVLKERKGKYYVINPTTPGDTIKLSGVDSMYLFDKPFNSNLPFPATLQTLLSTCCTDCGVNIGFGQFANWNFEVKSRPEDCTYREVVSWIAQIAGYNARISVNDELELVWYAIENITEDIADGGNFTYSELLMYDGGNFTDYSSGDSIDGGSFSDSTAETVNRISSLSVSTDDVIISGVKVEFDKVVALAGTEEYVISIKYNPLTESKEQEIADMLFARVGGLKTRPMSCQIPNNPLWEPFDACVVYDRKGNGYNALINSVTFSISGFTTIACNADDPVRNESSYTSEAAKAVVQARKNTERQLTLYGNAVQNMNDLAANAMGLYRESETLSDGSVIYYMSNRPIIKNENGICEFELDSVVYKMTGDGFFVSEDGGLSYTSGFDANGNAVVNVLSAIGITFDWARGGTLSLGGFDNVNGSLVVYDSEKNIIGGFDKDGLFAKNGSFKGTIESKNATITGGTIKIDSADSTEDIIKLSYGTSISVMRSGSMGTSKGNLSAFMSEDSVIVGNGSKTSSLRPDGLHINGGYFDSDTGIYTQKDLSVAGASNLTGNVSVNNVFVSGKMTFLSTGSISLNSLELSSTLSVAGKSTLKSLDVSGDSALKGNVSLGNTQFSTLKFFGGTGSTRKTVANIATTSTATASTIATKLNDLLTALRSYGLIG